MALGFTARIYGKAKTWKQIEGAVLDGRIPCGEPLSKFEILKRLGLTGKTQDRFEGYLMDLRTNRSPVRFRNAGGDSYIAESTAPINPPTN